ncbi:MAG: YajQ family cyclic di-GMP-binding protein, partial [Epsilonproteobacteria bacterium]|nr:YajQ family cyclic di-GMP-binding protein [Campylobacterota bacterium]
MAKAKEHYFDISAKLDMMEFKNALAMAQKEIVGRFDFKGILAEIELNEKSKAVTISSSSEQKIETLKDILVARLLKRGLSSSILDESKKENISGGNMKIVYALVDSIDKDEAREISKAIKELNLKVTSAIQGDEIRVSGKSIDDLQKVMSAVRKLELKAPLV